LSFFLDREVNDTRALQRLRESEKKTPATPP